MIKIYNKNEEIIFATFLGINIFTHSEFRCKCHTYSCRYTSISTVLISKFKKLRKLASNKPIIITSGFRCTRHNIVEGGGCLSQHQIGFALDLIPPKGVTLLEFNELALQAGFTFTKMYSDKNVLHVDVRNLD